MALRATRRVVENGLLYLSTCAGTSSATTRGATPARGGTLARGLCGVPLPCDLTVGWGVHPSTVLEASRVSGGALLGGRHSPVPASATTCALPAALSVMARVPLRDTVAF